VEGERVDDSVIVGATASSDPAQASDVDINRSGGSGSGGPVVADPQEEGSVGASMDELLTGDTPEGSEPGTD
jgi:hypothetical protein